jgi:tRNA threonylcarbamoyladenosine modification (KEOPS) complex  Pcc1 subunit
MFLLKISISFDSKSAAKRFFDSIKADLFEFERSSMKISQKEETIIISVSAQDKTALRASLNSILKPLVLFEQVEKLN